MVLPDYQDVLFNYPMRKTKDTGIREIVKI